MHLHSHRAPSKIHETWLFPPNKGTPPFTSCNVQVYNVRIPVSGPMAVVYLVDLAASLHQALGLLLPSDSYYSFKVFIVGHLILFT